MSKKKPLRRGRPKFDSKQADEINSEAKAALAGASTAQDRLLLYRTVLEQLADYIPGRRLRECQCEYLNRRAESYIELGQIDAALEDLNEAVKFRPDLALSYQSRGTLFDKQNLKEQALQDYATALKLQSGDVSVLISRGMIHAENHKYDSALADFNRAIQHDPDHAPAYENRGNVRVEQGLEAEALEDFNKAIELNADYASAYNSRACLFSAQGRYSEALADLNQAITLNPNHGAFYCTRGNIYKYQGEYSKALADFNTAVELRPDSPHVYSKRAQVYTAMGSETEAGNDEDEALKLYRNQEAKSESLMEHWTDLGLLESDKAASREEPPPAEEAEEPAPKPDKNKAREASIQELQQSPQKLYPSRRTHNTEMQQHPQKYLDSPVPDEAEKAPADISGEESERLRQALNERKAQPDSHKNLHKVVEIFYQQDNGRLEIAEAALKSAKDYKNFRHNNIAWKMLTALAVDLYQIKFIEGLRDIKSEFLRRTGLPYAKSEGRQTKRNSDYARSRQLKHNGKIYDIWAHLKWGKAKPDVLRVHFAYDEDSQKIIVGYIGPHLSNHSTLQLN
ncbi:tetratricopeptide repeat protein [Candidatus Haliotispira prima]|uniref:Tetratricopeptide repeat protein n=1 Tax=Candidatus Haliotispira prima TaxID=3034016 RepID=A0ABY8MLE0_9SPIO|nr:tetratricopeptide repeat protein [Candidatus Haliotispira prima]